MYKYIYICIELKVKRSGSDFNIIRTVHRTVLLMFFSSEQNWTVDDR